jgi:hypothetical protein
MNIAFVTAAGRLAWMLRTFVVRELFCARAQLNRDSMTLKNSKYSHVLSLI